MSRTEKIAAEIDRYHDAIGRNPGLRECLAPRIARLERVLLRAL